MGLPNSSSFLLLQEEKSVIVFLLVLSRGKTITSGSSRLCKNSRLRATAVLLLDHHPHASEHFTMVSQERQEAARRTLHTVPVAQLAPEEVRQNLDVLGVELQARHFLQGLPEQSDCPLASGPVTAGIRELRLELRDQVQHGQPGTFPSSQSIENPLQSLLTFRFRLTRLCADRNEVVHVLPFFSHAALPYFPPPGRE